MTRVRRRLLRVLVRGRRDVARLRSRVETGAADAWERGREACRRLWPELRRRLIEARRQAREAIRPSEIRRRAEAARVWAIEHDTVPEETVARARERWLDRQHRHEVRAIDRQHREEEHAKIREKQEEEERQTYSVFFE